MYKFNKVSNGYDPKEVNQFLDDIINRVEKIIKKSKNKDLEIKRLQEQIDKINKETKIDKINETINERDKIIEDANKKADLIIKNALNQSKRIQAEAKLLNDNITIFKSELKDNIEKQLYLIDNKIDDRDEYL
jgi:DivIVA domain-containing protein